MGQPKIYNTALYLRLSKDDGTDNESASIQTQKEMLTRYCRDNGFTICQTYIDDGWSGTNSDRPAFQRMLSDIEDGKINCVITKDLSRLGRNYIEVGGYTELFFPEHGVRYIAITDGVDTSKGSTMDITPFKNLLNDMYAQDISRKIKSALLTKQKQGKYIGTKAPYGYEKDPADKNHLIINEKYAVIVRRMFRMAMDGMGVKSIAKALSAEKIPRPAAVAAAEHAEFKKYANDGNEYLWAGSVVRDILRNPTYKGCVVGQKSEKISFRSKKRRFFKPEDRIVVEGMHEPIISPEEWDLVQNLITSRKKGVGESQKYDNIFCGLLRCPDCGYTLGLARNHKTWNEDDYNENFDYYCSRYRSHGTTACSKHRINAAALYEVVLSEIQRLAHEALTNNEGMAEYIVRSLDQADENESRRAKKEIKRAQKRLDEIDRLFAKLYEDNAKGNISERNYKSLSANYEREQTELERQIGDLNATIQTSRESSENAANFVSLIKEYSDIDELSQALLNTLIDRIEVHEPEEIDGEYVQLVDIYYKFVGMID